MADEAISCDREVDARGLNCPLPILRAKKALTDLAVARC
jgi:TusA-related sulfurtransferase